MFCHTSPYRRTDGTRARSYECRAYRFSDGTCSARPADAQLVDNAVIGGLHDLLSDFEAWVAGIEARYEGERRRLAELVERAQADRDEQACTVQAHERPVPALRRHGRR